jgi:hypothetical protein
MTAWLDANCGTGNWGMAPAGIRGVVNDALAIYFLDAALANAFVARWCIGYRAETVEGSYRLREDAQSQDHASAAPHIIGGRHDSTPRRSGDRLDIRRLDYPERREVGPHRLANVARGQVSVMALRHPGIGMPELRRDDGARHALDREAAGVRVPQDMKSDRRVILAASHAARIGRNWCVCCQGRPSARGNRRSPALLPAVACSKNVTPSADKYMCRALPPLVRPIWTGPPSRL